MELRQQEEEDRKVGLVVHGDVGHSDDHVGVGEQGDNRGDSRVGGQVEPVVVVEADGKADDEQPSDGSCDEKFVQGIGRKQSTAMSRTDGKIVAVRGLPYVTTAN